MKEVITDEKYAGKAATCISKMLEGNASTVALKKARSKAFVSEYMQNPEWDWRFTRGDIESAKNNTFVDWLDKIDVRDYFSNDALLKELLTGLSADELKVLLSDEMENYYDTFRKSTSAKNDEATSSRTCEDEDEDEDEYEDENKNKDEDEDEARGEDFLWNYCKKLVEGKDEEDANSHECQDLKGFTKSMTKVLECLKNVLASAEDSEKETPEKEDVKEKKAESSATPKANLKKGKTEKNENKSN